jgi:hypothetical protein
MYRTEKDYPLFCQIVSILSIPSEYFVFIIINVIFYNITYFNIGSKLSGGCIRQNSPFKRNTVSFRGASTLRHFDKLSVLKLSVRKLSVRKLSVRWLSLS